MSNLDAGWRLRLAAFARLRELHDQRGSDQATAAELSHGFEFEGERIRLSPPRQGIWRPRQADAALTIVTAPPHSGRPATYDDHVDETTGFYSYRNERTDPQLASNRAVRRAMELHRPLIYLIGLDKGNTPLYRLTQEAASLPVPQEVPMRIGRKEAILAFIATVIPFMGRKGNAQLPNRVPPGTLRTPLAQAPDLADMQRRIVALEAQLANQVAFTKDANGDLRLRGNGSVRIDAASNFTCWAGMQMDLRASSNASLKGATVALN